MPSRLSHRRRHSRSPLVVALYLNAALLACVLIALLSRGGDSVAFAAPPAGQPIAGGNGVYLMPGQMAINLWGCYVMDVERQTLCAYEYVPGRKQLQLVAARFIGHDRQLKDYNTSPPPQEIERLLKLQNAPVRGQEGNVPPVENQDVKPGDVPAKPAGEAPASGPASGPATKPAIDPDFVPKAKDINPE